MGRARVTVYTPVIQAMFEPGGMMANEANRVGDTMVNVARLIAPVRTGVLRAGIQKFGRGITNGRFQYVITVGSNAPHGLFVEEGTTGPIFPTNSLFLSVPISRGSFVKVPRMFVRGQDAQHYLYRGAEIALAEHGYPGSLHRTVRGRLA